MAWQIENPSQDQRVLIGMPHVGKFSEAVFLSWQAVDTAPFNRVWVTDRGRPIDQSRNIMVTKALQHNCDYLWMVDSDILIRPETFNQLQAAHQPVVSAMYRQRHPPHHIIATKAGVHVHVEEVEQFKGKNVFMQVQEVGMGCCLIDIRVIKKLVSKINQWHCFQDHSHDIKVEAAIFTDQEAKDTEYKCRYCNGLLLSWLFENRTARTAQQALSEDYYFCWLVNQAGFNIMLHTDCWVTHELGDGFRIDEKGISSSTTSVDSGVIR